jgi:hypothetical protein
MKHRRAFDAGPDGEIQTSFLDALLKEALPRRSPTREPILIEIAEVPITGTGPQKYSATLVDTGEVLVRKSRCPQFDACRVLLDRGITGVVHTRRKGSETISMELDVEEHAQFDVREGYSDPPRIVQYDAQKREEDRARLAQLQKKRRNQTRGGA